MAKEMTSVYGTDFTATNAENFSEFANSKGGQISDLKIKI
jgi:hypothetical protein